MNETIINYTSLLIVFVGIFSNIFMFIVFNRNALAKISVSIYFRVMAVINCFISVTFLKEFLTFQYKITLADRSTFLCKSISYTIYAVSSMAAWFLVLAGLDRFLVIAHPTRFHFIQKARFPLYCVIAMIVYNLIFYFYWIFEVDLVTFMVNSNNSTFKKCYLFNLKDFYLSHLINSTIIPFIMMVISTIGLLFVVYNSRKRMRKFEQSSKKSSSKRIRDLKFGISMIITNIVFLVLNAPFYIYNTTDKTSSFNWKKVFLILVYSYYSITFFLQLVVNNLVRNQFLSIFKRFYKN